MRPVVTWEPWWKRLAATVALILGLLLVLVGVAAVLGLLGGYGAAQSLSAPDLAARDDWGDLRRGATLDIVAFVPVYVAGGVALTRLVGGSRGQRTFVLVSLGLGAIADLVETFLFRRSLGRLIGGATADDIETLADVTRLATLFKIVGLVVALVGLVVIAVRGDTTRSSVRPSSAG